MSLVDKHKSEWEEETIVVVAARSLEVCTVWRLLRRGSSAGDEWPWKQVSNQHRIISADLRAQVRQWRTKPQPRKLAVRRQAKQPDLA